MNDGHSDEPADDWPGIRGSGDEPASNQIPSLAREWSDATKTREAALAAAQQYLAGAAGAAASGPAATDLPARLDQCRAHLSALLAASSLRAPLVRTVEETAAALAVSPWTVYQMVTRAELLTYRIARRCIRIDELALRDYRPAGSSPLGPHTLTGYDIPPGHLPATWQ